jgi:hypothetical protein
MNMIEERDKGEEARNGKPERGRERNKEQQRNRGRRSRMEI